MSILLVVSLSMCTYNSPCSPTSERRKTSSLGHYCTCTSKPKFILPDKGRETKMQNASALLSSFALYSSHSHLYLCVPSTGIAATVLLPLRAVGLQKGNDLSSFDCLLYSRSNLQNLIYLEPDGKLGGKKAAERRIFAFLLRQDGKRCV